MLRIRSAVRRQRGRANDAHVAGQHDEVGTGGRQGRRKGRVLRAAGRRVGRSGGRDQGGVDPPFRGPLEGRAGAVGEDEPDRAAELAPLSGRHQRPEVRAGTRHPDGDPRSAGGHPIGPSP